MTWKEAGLTSIKVSRVIEDGTGIAGIVLSLVYRVPQIYVIYKTKKAEDISVWMIFLQNASYVLAVAYGVFIHDWIYITASILSFVQNIIILQMKKYYKREAEKNKRPLEKNKLIPLNNMSDVSDVV